MTEMQTLEIRFSGEELASCRDNRGVVYRLFYHADDPSGPAWLEDGRGAGLTPAEIRRSWPLWTGAKPKDHSFGGCVW